MTHFGEPFELIDGDNLQFAERVLEKAFHACKDRVLVLSVLGPQSSGKSTLLNYLFGCRFSTSTGRCTKGIYAAIMKIEHPAYDKLMILDTEGLQSSEKDDQEFDRKITLFCLAVSHIVIINVKGDLHLPMKRLLEICLVSLHELKKAKIGTPDVFICTSLKTQSINIFWDVLYSGVSSFSSLLSSRFECPHFLLSFGASRISGLFPQTSYF